MFQEFMDATGLAPNDVRSVAVASLGMLLYFVIVRVPAAAGATGRTLASGYRRAVRGRTPKELSARTILLLEYLTPGTEWTAGSNELYRNEKAGPRIWIRKNPNSTSKPFAVYVGDLDTDGTSGLSKAEARMVLDAAAKCYVDQYAFNADKKMGLIVEKAAAADQAPKDITGTAFTNCVAYDNAGASIRLTVPTALSDEEILTRLKVGRAGFGRDEGYYHYLPVRVLSASNPAVLRMILLGTTNSSAPVLFNVKGNDVRTVVIDQGCNFAVLKT